MFHLEYNLFASQQMNTLSETPKWLTMNRMLTNLTSLCFIALNSAHNNEANNENEAQSGT